MKESLQQSQIENNEAKIDRYKKTKDKLLELFVTKDSEQKDEFYSEIRSFASAIGLDPESIIEKIENNFTLENAEEFVTQSFEALKDLIDKVIEHPKIFEDMRRERIIQRSGNIKLSELMYYDIDLENGIARIHIAPKGNLGLSVIIRSFREGLNELARQVKKDERIKEIQAASWIVASNPGLLERAGFIVEGPIDEKTRAEHFEDEKRPISWAHMSRESLLEKYLF